MSEETVQIILYAVTGTAGVLLTKGYDAYQKKRNKSDKADALQSMYAILEEVYSQDLELQKKLNAIAKENEDLKVLINELENNESTTSN